MIVVVVAVIAGFLVIAATATYALAAINLNSSKSNIYRQSTNQNLSVDGGSASQVSTNVCTCTSNDEITINNNEG
jgi:uncharacterized membrane protein YidH (DUF202 family)